MQRFNRSGNQVLCTCNTARIESIENRIQHLFACLSNPVRPDLEKKTGVTMPIYEYECNSCQRIFEVVQRISEEPLTRCPDCHGMLTKLISMSAFHLKGSGWYADGYGNSSGKGGNGGGSGRNGGSQPSSATTGKTADNSPPAKAKEAASEKASV